MAKLRMWVLFALLTAAVGGALIDRAVGPPAPTSHAPLVLPAGLPRMTPAAATDDLPGSGQYAALFDMAEDFRAHGLPVETVLSPQGGPGEGLFFFEGRPDPGRLWRLPDRPEYADCFRGSACCHKAPDRQFDDEILAAWGDCGARVGPFLLFGDPVWMARVRAAFPAR